MSRTRTALLLPARGAPAVQHALPIDHLPTLQKLVGGYIEVVRLSRTQIQRAQNVAKLVQPLGAPGHVFLVLNELGKINGLPPNPIATAIMGAEFDDVIVGDAFVCEMPPDAGEGEA